MIYPIGCDENNDYIEDESQWKYYYTESEEDGSGKLITREEYNEMNDEITKEIERDELKEYSVNDKEAIEELLLSVE